MGVSVIKIAHLLIGGREGTMILNFMLYMLYLLKDSMFCICISLDLWGLFIELLDPSMPLDTHCMIQNCTC